MKVLIIGGVAAGMSAASKLKRMAKDTRIIVYEKGNHLSYGACGLPYYVSGENDDYKKMIIRTKEQFEKIGIEAHLQHEAVKLVPEKKQVMIRDRTSGRLFLDNYDKLLIATGASPVVPDIPGVSLKNIHVLKTLEDGLSLKQAADNTNIRDVTIVGGGYIGIEVAEAMLRLGKKVSIIELSDRILNNFDAEITDIVTSHLSEKGVIVHLGEKVESFIGTNEVRSVKTKNAEISANLVVIAAGVKPATRFLADTGIALGQNGAVIIDREMRTSIKDVYAAGDCAEVYHKVKEENAYIPLGTNANKCGRIVGANMSGQRSKYVGTLGSAALRVCDFELGKTGLSEADAKECGLYYATAFVEADDRPPYFPNHGKIWIKLVCEKPTKRILGAQAIGKDGVALRINTFAVAIHNNMCADDLGMTDLIYAPPFSGVWDAIHIACNAVNLSRMEQ